VSNNCFSPFEIQIDVGDTISWRNDDAAKHTVTSGNLVEGPDGKFDSSIFSPKQSFSHIFTEEGTYPYFCLIHPWMEGLVIVADDSIEVIKPETTVSITIIGNDVIEIGADSLIADVEIEFYDPRIGNYFIEIIHKETNNLVSISQVFPKVTTGNTWGIPIDLDFQGYLPGSYEIIISSEFGTSANATFSVIESVHEPISSPIKQWNEGIKSIDVSCIEGLELVIKLSNETPACVKSTSIEKLIDRGWAIRILPDPTN